MEIAFWQQIIKNKIIMAFKVNAYQADQTNVNRLWDLQANRTNHLRKLETIYKQRQEIRTKSQKDHLRRQKQLEGYQKTKLKDYDHRNKSLQDKINYQNSLLRNKILQVYQGNMYSSGYGNISGSSSETKRKARSIYSNDIDRTNYYKLNLAEQMYQTNMKIGQKLSKIKSQVSNLCNIQQHAKKTQMLLDMIQKKSPKKKAYLKNLAKKKTYNPYNLPEIQDSTMHFF